MLTFERTRKTKITNENYTMLKFFLYILFIQIIRLDVSVVFWEIKAQSFGAVAKRIKKSFFAVVYFRDGLYLLSWLAFASCQQMDLTKDTCTLLILIGLFCSGSASSALAH